MLKTQCGTILGENPVTHWQDNYVRFFPYQYGHQFGLIETDKYSGYEFASLGLKTSTSTTIWGFAECLIHRVGSYLIFSGTKRHTFKHMSRPSAMASTDQIIFYTNQDLLTWYAIETMADTYISQQSGGNILWKWDVITRRQDIHWFKNLYMALCPNRKNMWFNNIRTGIRRIPRGCYFSDPLRDFVHPISATLGCYFSDPLRDFVLPISATLGFLE